MMVVLEYGDVVFRVFDAMARGDQPTKVLMSPRQFAAYEDGRHRTYRNTLNALPSTRKRMEIFEVPIVICPDCDLYVVPT